MFSSEMMDFESNYMRRLLRSSEKKEMKITRMQGLVFLKECFLSAPKEILMLTDKMDWSVFAVDMISDSLIEAYKANPQIKVASLFRSEVPDYSSCLTPILINDSHLVRSVTETPVTGAVFVIDGKHGMYFDKLDGSNGVAYVNDSNWGQAQRQMIHALMEKYRDRDILAPIKKAEQKQSMGRYLNRSERENC